MRALVQRVRSANVRVEGELISEIGVGLLVLLGVARTDTEAHAVTLAGKVSGLRILRDERSLVDTPGAAALVVSQFTLYGDTRKGRRPSWTAAAPGPVSEPLYDAFCAALTGLGAHVERGVFGARMRVSSVNEGPFTVLLER